MSLIEDILATHPELERNTRARKSDLVAILGDVGVTVPLAEAALLDISKPTKIRKFRAEFVDYIALEFDLTSLEAEKRADEIIGYASVVAGEKRRTWFDSLDNISHPIFGRVIIPNTGRVITGLEVNLHDSDLSESFETHLQNLTPVLLVGQVSYQRLDNSTKFHLSCSGHVSESEKYIAFLFGVLDSIRTEIKAETGSEMDYSLRWNAKSLSMDPGGVQAYWQDKLRYTRMGDSWFIQGLKKHSGTTQAWFEDARVGEYGASCMDGTPAPSGLHLQFNLSEGCVGEGVGVIVGWSFLGSQIDDYLKASQVTEAKALLGKPVKIYELRNQIVGVQAYKPR